MNGKTKIKKIIFLLAIFFLLPDFVLAAPNISSVSGIINDGENVILNGGNFGSNSSVGTSSLQFIGDNIENGEVNSVFSMPGWGVYSDVEGPTNAVPKYSQSQAHSGTKSIVLDYKMVDGSVRYKGNFYRDHGSMIQRMYLSFWVRSGGDTGVTEGQANQWKIWRLKNGDGFVDGLLDFIQTTFTPGQNIAALVSVPATSAFDCNGCANEPATPGIYLGEDLVPGPAGVQNRWVRMEYWIDAGTVDNYDGTLVYKFHDPSNVTPAIKDVPALTFENNLMIRKTGGSGAEWSAAIFGGASVDGMEILTYWDDVFMQVGSWARVEIGNSSTWSACTHREIQVPTSWNNTSLNFDLQKGSFNSGDTVYLYVVDENGEVNANGYPIVLSGESDIITPTAPSGLVML